MFLHSDFVEPKAFKPTSQMFTTDRWQRYEGAGKGARSRMRETEAMKLAQEQVTQEYEEQEKAIRNTGALQSEHMASFRGAEGQPSQAMGKRIMKTQDGTEVRQQLLLSPCEMLTPSHMRACSPRRQKGTRRGWWRRASCSRTLLAQWAPPAAFPMKP